jgi:hypothetical protein
MSAISRGAQRKPAIMTSHRSRLKRALIVFTGVTIAGLVLLDDILSRGKIELGKYQIALLAGALSFALLGLVLPAGRVLGAACKLSLAALSCVLVVGALEGAGRIFGIDFGQGKRYFESLPVYYRWPILPVGDAYYRRPGPDQWTGQVLRTGMKAEGYVDDAYADEPVRTIKYDDLGFRNPPDLADWDIVVVGDSFTELGYLPDDELFTSLLAQRLGKLVKNLGVCHTGPLTHLFYAKEYGKSPSTRHAVLVFFEGNDVEDMVMEDQRRELIRRTGERELRTFEKQTSLLRAVREAVGRASKKLIAQNAFVRCGDREFGVTVKYTPRGRDQMSPAERTLLESTIGDWGRSMRECGMKPWLVYMPCKRRVMHDRLRFMEDCKPFIARWQPSDLPQYVREICTAAEIGYIDAVVPLTREIEQGRLSYNLIKDTHINALGSRVVADAIADALRPEFATPTTHAATPPAAAH